MSAIAISYGSIGNAAGEAKDVARKLDGYANEITRSIYNKLNNYSGEWSGNVSSASSNLNSKINALQTEAGKYETYQTNLNDLKSTCKSTDEAVKSRVSSLTAAFKANHGIKNSKVENALNYFMTSLGNSSAAGRWLGDGKDMWDAGNDYIKQSIEDWYDYEGGKQLIQGVLMAIVEGVVAIAAIVVAVVALCAGPAGWALIAAIAGLVGGIIALTNAAVNLEMECFAYYETNHNDDPATGRRDSDLNTFQDVLRKRTDSEFLHNVATGIDIVNFACTAITVVDSLGQLLTKGMAWLTCQGQIKHLSDFGKVNFSAVKTGVIQRFSKIRFNFEVTKLSIKMDPLGTLGLMAKQGGSNFLATLKNSFTNFGQTALTDVDKADNIYKTIKNYGNFAKDILGDGLDINDIVKNMALNGVGITHNDSAGGNFTSLDSIGKFEIKLGDYKKFTDISTKIGEGGIDLYETLCLDSGINVSIPEISVPQVNIPNVTVENINVPDINIPDINVSLAY